MAAIIIILYVRQKIEYTCGTVVNLGTKKEGCRIAPIYNNNM